VTRTGIFLTLWTLAVLGAVSAFILYLALRVSSIEIGYELGRVHAKVARLREVKRVLELELASQKTPERVEFVARALFDMSAPDAQRLIAAGPEPVDENQAMGENQEP